MFQASFRLQAVNLHFLFGQISGTDTCNDDGMMYIGFSAFITWRDKLDMSIPPVPLAAGTAPMIADAP